MVQLIAFLLMRGTVNGWFSASILLAVLAMSLISRYGKFLVQWLSGIRGRDWTMVSAVVDVVSVVAEIVPTREGRVRNASYTVTLTYFYRNPELQMGEYSRMFTDEESGRAWGASFKGRSVMVHVDPRDPSRSVLRKEEL